MSYEEAIALLEVIRYYFEFQEALAEINFHLASLIESEGEEH